MFHHGRTPRIFKLDESETGLAFIAPESHKILDRCEALISSILFLEEAQWLVLMWTLARDRVILRKPLFHHRMAPIESHKSLNQMGKRHSKKGDNNLWLISVRVDIEL